MRTNNDNPIVVGDSAVDLKNLHNKAKKLSKKTNWTTYDAALSPGVRELLNGDNLLKRVWSIFLGDLGVVP